MSNPFVDANLSYYNPTAYKRAMDERDWSQRAQLNAQIFGQPVGQMESLVGVDANTNEYYEKLRRNLAVSGNPFMMDQADSMYQQQQGDVFAEKNLPDMYRRYIRTLTDPSQASGPGFNAFLNEQQSLGATRVSVDARVFGNNMVGTDIAKDYINLKTGQPVNPATTPEAFRAGVESGEYGFVDADQKKKVQALIQAEGVVDSLNKQFAEIANDIPAGKGVTGAAKRYIYGASQSFTQDDGGKIKAYFDTSRASLSPIIKALGESGALSDGDVARANGLLAEIGSFNPLDPVDTPETALRKMQEVMKIIQIAKNSKGVKTAQSTYMPFHDIKTGKTVIKRAEWIDGQWIVDEKW